MAVLPIGIGSAAGAGGYQIERSLRFNSADSAYLNRTPSSAGNRKTWTWSGWVKRSALGTEQMLFGAYDNSSANDSTYTGIFLGAGNTLALSGWSQNWRVTTQVFRDASAWYHIVVALDTTQATANNRVKIYVNGVEVTAFGTTNNPTQNADLGINATNQHGLGRINYLTGSGPYYFNGYLTEVNFIDGQALTPSSFGETDSATGVWKPKAFSGTYGTNGFYLKFADNSGTTSTTLGKDSSGNGNNWTPNNFSVTAGAGNDSLVDTPTSYGTDTGAGGEVRGNYATINVLSNLNSTTLSNGNLDFLSTSGNSSIFGTIGVSSGKWYWEVVCYEDVMAGVSDTQRSGGTYPGNFANSCAWNTYFSMPTNLYQSGTFTKNGSPSTAGATTGQIIGVALDMDAGNLYFYVNGSVTNSGNPVFNSITGTVFPVFRGSLSTTSSVNFGQRPFAYTAPSGFKALCTQNLPTPTIGATSTTQANRYFDVVTRSGFGSSGGSISTLNFQPDFSWSKIRNSAASHNLVDAVRGVSKLLFTDTTAAELTYANYINSFNSNGYTLGSNDYATTLTAVDWLWKANGAGSSNTAGTITSTVSANTTSGFSICTLTASTSAFTFGHGLGAVPKLVIFKDRNLAVDWWVSHTSLGTNSLRLNTTAAQIVGGYWGTHTTSVVSVNSPSSFGMSASPHVAYCFAEVAGYSKFGSYTGNGSTDGPFVFCGFRPAFVMWKRSDSTGSWYIQDMKRNPYNQATNTLYPNLSDAETGGDDMDYLSNGFKVRDTFSYINASGGTYIYAAFAENPFKYALAR